MEGAGICMGLVQRTAGHYWTDLFNNMIMDHRDKTNYIATGDTEVAESPPQDLIKVTRGHNLQALWRYTRITQQGSTKRPGTFPWSVAIGKDGAAGLLVGREGTTILWLEKLTSCRISVDKVWVTLRPNCSYALRFAVSRALLAAAIIA